MNVGHVAAVLPVPNSADGRGLSRRLVDAEHEHHAADQMDEEIAGDAGAILLPAAPASEDDRVERDLGCDVALPGIPIQGLRGQIERRRILPCTGWIVAA